MKDIIEVVNYRRDLRLRENRCYRSIYIYNVHYAPEMSNPFMEAGEKRIAILW